MDVTVTIPDKHLTRVAAAYSLEVQSDPELKAVLDGGTAAEKKAALAAFFGDRWRDEVKGRVVAAETAAAARTAVQTTAATLGDNPLAS